MKFLTSDLSKKQVEELHSDALKLYKDYLDKDSYNFISCPLEVTEEYKYLVQEYYTVEKLSKLAKLLCRAYDHTYTLVEVLWLPKFFHSSEVCCTIVQNYFSLT